MTTKPRVLRAPAVALKLEAARQALQLHNNDVALAALDAAENAPGAAKRLADLREKISSAERDFAELEKAYALAASLDRQSDALGAASMREEQFAIMKQRAEVRLKAVAMIMDSIATAAAAYSTYAVATNEMVTALPTGARMPFIAIGRNGYGGSWVGDLKNLISAEAWRLVIVDEHGRGARLPFSQQPELRPALELMTEAQETVMRDIEEQMTRLNEQQMALASEEAA